MLSKLDYAMIHVSDMGRSVAFYRDTLGLPLKFQSPGWSEFDTGSTTLALHPAAPANGNKTATHGQLSAGACSLGFSVQDLNSTYADLGARGAHFVVPPTDQPNEGIRLAVCIDPDGLPISFAETLTRP